MTEFFLDGAEFERYGEDNLERALNYFFPNIIARKESRYFYRKSPDGGFVQNPFLNYVYDFTLYVNRKYRDTIFLEDINPYAIKFIQIWEDTEMFSTAPMDMPIHQGKYVMNIVTK